MQTVGNVEEIERGGVSLDVERVIDSILTTRKKFQGVFKDINVKQLIEEGRM